MALAFDLQPPQTEFSSFERAILETLAYSDIFDYPLKLDELHRYLTTPASLEQVAACLSQTELVESKNDFYFLKGRADIVSLRLQRERISSKSFARALSYGRILGGLPFIRMVALTGSLAVRNCDETGDYDYMLVARTGRVWLARAFALLLNRIANLLGETLCPNLIISERTLEWPAHDLYSAREICQMIPISGEGVYSALRVANPWVSGFLPNVSAPVIVDKVKDPHPSFQRILEIPLRSEFGGRLETWEMTRKVARFTRQAGYGLETNFNADICQGNFDHHGSWTMKKYHERLSRLGLVPFSQNGRGVRGEGT